MDFDLGFSAAVVGVEGLAAGGLAVIGGGVGRGGGGGGLMPAPTVAPPKGVLIVVACGGGGGTAEATGIGEPHLKQNLAVAVFSAWQFGQITPMVFNFLK